MERCDYQGILKIAPWLLKQGQDAVVSPDIDGLLSYAFFSHCQGWRLCGIYRLDALFLAQPVLERLQSNQANDAPVFLDHDINRPEIPSIGHHLLRVSAKLPAGTHSAGASVNPNLLRGITKAQFQRKYPFATIHFAMGLLGTAGALISDFTELGLAVLLHVDSSFRNAFNYQTNALDWIQWMGGEDASSPLAPFCKTLLRANPFRILKILDDLAREFESVGLKPRQQTILEDPTEPEQWAKVSLFFEWVGANLGWEARLPSVDTVKKWRKAGLERRSFKPTAKNFQEQVLKKPPFAYAIISRTQFDGLNCAWLPSK